MFFFITSKSRIQILIRPFLSIYYLWLSRIYIRICVFCVTAIFFMYSPKGLVNWIFEYISKQHKTDIEYEACVIIFRAKQCFPNATVLRLHSTPHIFLQMPTVIIFNQSRLVSVTCRLEITLLLRGFNLLLFCKIRKIKTVDERCNWPFVWNILFYVRF